MKFVAIVDPISSGAFLPPIISKRVLKPIAVLSRKSTYERFHINESDFHKIILGNADTEHGVEDILNKLSAFDVAAVIPGCEIGVSLGDYLSSELGCPTNGTELSPARRDKFLMHECLRKAGLDHIYQARCQTVEDGIAWLKHTKIDFPVVVKPPASAGADNVRLVFSEKELIECAKTILTSKTTGGNKSEAFLVQEYIQGPEFAVNTVSCLGTHFSTDVISYYKGKVGPQHFTYLEEHYSPPNEELAPVVTYCHKVLDALGIRFGASHAEIVWSKRGPVLMEVGARLCGSEIPPMIERIAKTSPLTLTVDAYIDKHAFFDKTQKPQEFFTYPARYYFRSHISGQLQSVRHMDWIKTLASFSKIVGDLTPGTLIEVSDKLISQPGWIELIHPDKEQLSQDLAMIRAADEETPILDVRH